jgi:hypothetical protein
MITSAGGSFPSNKSATISQRGGARLGLLNATWPFARLSADELTLQLSCLGWRFEFRNDHSLVLSRYGGLVSSGLQIEHQNRSYPNRIIFWCWNFQALSEQLNKLGYRVRA